jgi:hypothetical protein
VIDAILLEAMQQAPMGNANHLISTLVGLVEMELQARLARMGGGHVLVRLHWRTIDALKRQALLTPSAAANDRAQDVIRAMVRLVELEHQTRLERQVACDYELA